MRRVLRRIRYLLRLRHHDAELAEEMRFHKELAGARAFGNDALAQNRARDIWIAPWLQDISQDVRFAVRVLGKDKRFTVAAVLALGLAIGVNNSVFTIINMVFMRAVPFEDGHQLVSVGTITPRGDQGGMSLLDLQDLEQASLAFEGFAAATGGRMNVSDAGRLPERFRGAYVSANAFRLLRSTPILGRDFLPEDDRRGAPSVAILGYGVWMDRYGGDAGVIGRVVKINDAPTTIIGVMPRGFTYPVAEMWQPLGQSPGLAAPTLSRGARNLGVIGRLEGEAAEAQAKIDTIANRLARQYPDTNKDVRIAIRDLKAFAARQSRPMLTTMMGAVVLVLLVACANLANLLLARAAVRSREIAIRASLGATRWRIVRQLLIECTLIAALAGILGHAFSYVGARQIALAFDAMEPGGGGSTIRPYYVDLSTNGYDYAFVGLLCLFATLAFGMVPSLHMARTNVHDTLKEGGRNTGGVRVRRWASGLMVAELALTLVLLTAAGLLWRNFVAQYRADLGVDTRNLVTMSLDLPVQKYRAPEQRQQFFARLEERFDALPAVTSATTTTQLPLMFFPTPPRQVAVDGHPVGEGMTAPSVTAVLVGARFFETFGIVPLRGRPLTSADSQPGQEGVVINDRTASLLFPDEEPLGRRLQLTSSAPPVAPTPWLTVVGVTPTLRRPGAVAADDLQSLTVYLPASLESPSRATIVARGRESAAAAAAALREEVRAIDPDLPLFGVEPFDQAIARSRFGVRLVGTWFGVIAVITLIVTSVGLFALTAHGVAQRRQEIGVRVALGAEARQVVWIFVRRTLLQLAAGLAIGLVGALTVGQFVGYLGSISPRDPITIALVVALLSVVAVVATLLPARRAARVDPMTALRAD
ncbi:MAG TPA: ADOP family duplicated permease [Vicinamibacterales bacterium]|nr:ADOP family duplicated permease [Vicinamibacterales bacterium]